jgi:hypothetical protein
MKSLLSGKSAGLPIDLLKPLKSVLAAHLSSHFSFLLANGVVPILLNERQCHSSSQNSSPHYVKEILRKDFETVQSVEPLAPEQ